MAKVALLTCKDLGKYIVDESYLEEALKGLGHEVTWLEWDHSSADWASFDLVLLRTTWDYTKKRDAFLAQLEKIQSCGVRLVNSSDVVRKNSDKSYIVDLFEQGLRVIPSALFREDQLNRYYDQFSCDQLVIKPRVGASAENIVVLNKGDVLPALLEGKDYFVQPFLDEIAEGEVSLCFFDKELSHSVIKRPKGGDFRVQEEHGGSTEPYSPEASLVSWAAEFLHPEMRYARVDVAKYKGEWCLMELELIEPSFYFRHCPMAASNFAQAIDQWVSR